MDEPESILTLAATPLIRASMTAFTLPSSAAVGPSPRPGVAIEGGGAVEVVCPCVKADVLMVVAVVRAGVAETVAIDRRVPPVAAAVD